MVKRFLLLVSLLTIFVTGFAFADVSRGRVPDTEATLGGVRLGSSMEYVRSVYGKPTETYWGQDRTRQRARINSYGKGFYIIESVYGYHYSVLELKTEANNGIATPMGITVGVPKATVEKLYGVSSFEQMGADVYLTTEGRRIAITYGKDKNGVIVVKKIHIYYPS